MPEHVYTKLLAGQQQLWTAMSGAAFLASLITQIETRDAARVLVVRYVAGKVMTDWVTPMHHELQKMARAVQCTSIEAIGRPGLFTHLKPLDWRKVAVVYQVDVSDG